MHGCLPIPVEGMLALPKGKECHLKTLFRCILHHPLIQADKEFLLSKPFRQHANNGSGLIQYLRYLMNVLMHFSIKNVEETVSPYDPVS